MGEVFEAPPWAALLSFAFTLILTPVVLSGLARWNVLDHPSDRSLHDSPIPRGGGISPALVTLVLALLGMMQMDEWSWGLAIAGVGFLLIGALEDFRGVPALNRFLMQIGAASAGAVFFAASTDKWMWRVIVFLAAVAWLVSFANAFNFMDGINGISVAQVLVAGVTWSLAGQIRDLAPFSLIALLGAGAVLGFGPYNFPRAKLFLGDSGSYFLGAWLAYAALIGLQEGLPPETVLAPLGLYLADSGSTLLRRIRGGEAWSAPHREHVYQRLVAQGRSHAAVTSLVFGLLVLCSVFGALALTDVIALRIGADIALCAVLWGYLQLPRIAVREAQSDFR